jgi:hypothetical protein
MAATIQLSVMSVYLPVARVGRGGGSTLHRVGLDPCGPRMKRAR